MRFNPSKCNILHIHRVDHHVPYLYEFWGCVLQLVYVQCQIPWRHHQWQSGMVGPSQQCRQEGQHLLSLHLQEPEALHLYGVWDCLLYHHPQQSKILFIYMGSQTTEGQGHPREGQLTWSTHGLQQNLARQLSEPHTTSKGAEVAAPWNQVLPPMHVPHV